MTETCSEMHLLLQADTDAELTPAEAARVAHHLSTCPDCPGAQAQLLALSAQIRREASYHPASATLSDTVRRQIAAHTTEPPAETARPAPKPSWPVRLSRPRFATAAPFGAGLALAAVLVLAIMPSNRTNPTETLVAGHIRALQPGHLMDVVSTDQHTVKPWFDGRLDFAPPVKDLKDAGFPLEGGRLDYLENRPVAALIYQRRQHLIDLFVWPGTGDHATPAKSEHNGYNALRWSDNGMTFWAVSDLNAAELAEFVTRWQSIP